MRCIVRCRLAMRRPAFAKQISRCVGLLIAPNREPTISGGAMSISTNWYVQYIYPTRWAGEHIKTNSATQALLRRDSKAVRKTAESCRGSCASRYTQSHVVRHNVKIYCTNRWAEIYSNRCPDGQLLDRTGSGRWRGQGEQ